jgi:TatD DNase family protein
MPASLRGSFAHDFVGRHNPPVQEIVDIGANLSHDSFDDDREAVIERAATAGVTRLIVTGTSVTTSVQALALTERYPGRLFATAGIHPHHATTVDDHGIAALSNLAASNSVVAVGECGLDFFRDFSPHDAQRSAFVALLELASNVGKPVFLHQRDAHAEFVRLLAPWRPRLPGGVAHCFTGGPDELRDYLELDLYIGVTGWVCDERRGDSLRAALPNIPLDRLLIETDAPYLLPRDLPIKPRSRRNEPAFLRHVLERIALELDTPADAIAQATTENAERLFGLPHLR